MSLDPQIEALLAQLAENPAPKIQDLSPADARATYLAMASVLEMPDVPIGKTEDISIPGPAGDIPARIYRPVAGGGAALPCLVFFHGGGFVIGDLDTHDVLCRTLANEAGVCVVAVDYRLARRFRYRNLCIGALEYLWGLSLQCFGSGYRGLFTLCIF